MWRNWIFFSRMEDILGDTIFWGRGCRKGEHFPWGMTSRWFLSRRPPWGAYARIGCHQSTSLVLSPVFTVRGCSLPSDNAQCVPQSWSQFFQTRFFKKQFTHFSGLGAWPLSHVAVRGDLGEEMEALGWPCALVGELFCGPAALSPCVWEHVAACTDAVQHQCQEFGAPKIWVRGRQPVQAGY